MESKYHDETSPDPTVGDRVDPKQIQFWLQECEEKHGARCNTADDQSLAQMTELRFIDVVDHCIVNAQPRMRYFALSYMWGGVDQMQLTIENVGELSSPASLWQYWTKIPMVVQDAIQFVAALNERYLWVDSLCIVQNDARMKHHQILQMGGIYNGAVACLVGAVGNNAHSGLAGIRPHTRTPEQRKLQYEAVYLIDPGPDQYTSLRKPRDSTPFIKLHSRLKPRQSDFNDRLSRSNYNSRAWTYQERLLSRRCIYFMDNMVVFHCRIVIRGENKTTPYSEKSQDIRRLSLFKADPVFSGDPFRYHRTLGALYSEIVTEYRRKKLTFSSDALNAFTGIGAALEKLCSWRLISGLPETLIDYALLWFPVRSSQRRFQEPGNNMFPSWSWASWDGEISYTNIYRVEANFEPYLGDMQSLIQNLTIYGLDGPQTIQSLVSAKADFSLDAKIVQKNGVLDWTKEMIDVQQPRNTLLFQALVISFTDFWTSSYNFKPIKQDGIDVYFESLRLNLLEAVVLRASWTSGFLFCNHQDLITIDRLSCDIILLSVVKRIGEDFEEFDDRCYINVMLVRWIGDFAERIAVGQVTGLPEMLGAHTSAANVTDRVFRSKGLLVKNCSWKTIKLI